MTSAKGLVRHTVYALMALAATLAVVQGRRIRLAAAAPVGRYTAAQAMAKSSALMGELTDYEPGLLLTADSAVSATGAPYPVALWTVSCFDAQGSERAIVSFDATTSRLRGASKRVRSREVGIPVVRSWMAARAAMNWLTALGPEDGSNDWIARSTAPGSNSWIVELENSGRSAKVTVGRRTGEIWSAYLSP
jgi:hypothetical protein